jgi:tripartite-type tricarboxylate transporter receptor subunit TctC
VGTPVHMAGELLKLKAHIDIVHIPYKGAGPAFTDLLGGHLQLMFPTLQSAVPHVKSGRLRLLALTSEKRSPAFPDIPIMEEAGVPGVVAMAWFGIHAPKATPKSVIARLHDEAVNVLRDPTVKERFSTEGADAVGSSPEQFAKFVADEIAKWTKVVKDGGIKAEF